MNPGCVNALRHCLEPVPGATNLIGGEPRVDFVRLFDDEWLAGLSQGERALVQLGLQLYNGGNIPERWELNRCLQHLDRFGRHRFIEAIGMVHDETWVLSERVGS